jgi:hypothetical protein
VAEEQLVHVPEPVLEGGGLGGSGRGQGVRLDPGQREMPEGEPHTVAQFCLDALDRRKRLPRVRALVIAVLDNQATRSRAADVIHRLIDRFQGTLVPTGAPALQGYRCVRSRAAPTRDEDWHPV